MLERLGWYPALMRCTFNVVLIYLIAFKETRSADDFALLACLGCTMVVVHIDALAKRIPAAPPEVSPDA